MNKTYFQKTHLAALRGIQEYALTLENTKERVLEFLKEYGSHCQSGVQNLGRYFYWAGLVQRECNMKILHEITNQLFTICEEKALYFPASKEGIWYSPQSLLKCDEWSEEKKDILKHVKLQVAHCGSFINSINLLEWKDSKEMDQLNRIPNLNVDIVPAWELIQKHRTQFTLPDWLADMIQESFNELVKKDQYCSLHIPTIPIPGQWGKLVQELNLQEYCSAKLSLQTVRSLRLKSPEALRKQDLPREILQHIMLMNSNCREESIYEFSKTQPKQNPLKAILRRGKETKSTEMFPHPMDMILLLFTCSDFMLRQVLASKLFMCQLAIPFIVPTPDDKIEMLLWPLRSIVVEWQNQEETLVKCKSHIVAFIRYGNTTFSKSKMMNAILSPSGHTVFFHKEAPCGREKRLISNGSVEMSHFLPCGGKKDPFKEPALFFNLRGDACDYRVQHGLLMDLASVLVIIIDIGEVYTSTVNEMLQLTSKKMNNTIILLTNSRRLSERHTAQAVETLINVMCRENEEDTFILTFDEGYERNETDVTHDVISAIKTKMVKSPKQALQDIRNSSRKYIIDDITDSHCSSGKSIADDIVSDMCHISLQERKQQLLPQQGENLHNMRKLLRSLHRTSSKDDTLSDKEEIRKQISTVREHQLKTLHSNNFIKKVMSIFQSDTKTQAFAVRWLQLELDEMSRSHLSALHEVKNKKWHDLMQGRTDNSSECAALKLELHQAEMNISAATCGFEHLMREMAQMYDVTTHMKWDQKFQAQYDVFLMSDFPDTVARLLLEGHPTELMDGDHGVVPLVWVKAVFNSVTRRVGNDKKVFVLSIMGIQSSGKSTLLNTMFGLQFSVSAGRCTRGIYAQLLPASKGSKLPFDYLMVLDSEGLRAQGVSHSLEHDNELATLIIGLADITLINSKGESLAEIKDILQIAVHAFLRMNQADSPHRRQGMFIHQNVSATNVKTKLATDRQQLQEELDKMTKEASEALGLPETITTFSRIINNCQCDVVYFLDLWHGVPPMANHQPRIFQESS